MLRCGAGRVDSSAITKLISRMSNALLLQADVTANTPEDKALLKR
jgi:thiol:disulfide interchange protein